VPRGSTTFIHIPGRESPKLALPIHPKLTAYLFSYSNMSDGPLDASAVLTLKLLDFLASQRPSAQAKRGDRRLDDARQLARENESLISPIDLEIAKDKIIL
jgi:hypothetical protein